MFRYAVDTCSLTQLRRSYPSDIFPGVWQKFDALISQMAICSVEEVYFEIMAQDDGLADWAKLHREIFLPPDEQLQRMVQGILKTHSNLLDVRKDKSGADPWIIAAAMIHKCAVVSEEKPSGGPDRSKIPDVCRHYSVDCIQLLEMLRREGLKL